jgi:putative membrane protein
MTFHDIPAINAALNALATVLITLGFVQIKAAQRAGEASVRSARIQTHRRLMLGAGFVSAVFLIGYVSHKYLKGMAARELGEAVHTKFGGEGFIAVVYYVMLITHIILAIAIAYLVPRTFFLALSGQIERHRKWAKWTYPIWYYVSVTGVLVYFFLYQWWPAAN